LPCGNCIPEARPEIKEIRAGRRGRAFLHRTAGEIDSGASGDLLVPLREVKVACTTAAQEVAARAMKVCGGAAFASRSPVERALRDAQAGSIMAPTSDVLKEFIRKAVLGLPLF
jgi:alkylation response protein AidB-like acyl-CoA dehydrogenase